MVGMSPTQSLHDVDGWPGEWRLSRMLAPLKVFNVKAGLLPLETTGLVPYSLRLSCFSPYGKNKALSLFLFSHHLLMLIYWVSISPATSRCQRR